MAKRKQKKQYTNRILAIAGLFTAGSILGASVDVSSLFEVNYRTPASTITESEEDSSTVEPLTSLQTSLPSSVSVELPETEEVVSAKEDISSEQSTENTELVPAIDDTSEIPSLNSAEPPAEIPSKQEQQPKEPSDWTSDWMEAIFIPTEPANAPTEENWMELQTGDTLPAQPSAESQAMSSMSSEMAEMLEGIAVFWTPTGEKIHMNPDCRSFEEGAVRYAGMLEEAQSVRAEGWCKLCADHLSNAENSEFYIKGNIYATVDQLMKAYTYDDYCNGIPGN